MSCSLVFIDDLNELKQLVDFIEDDTIIISTEAEVSADLERRGIPYKNTLSFVSSETHRSIISLSNSVIKGIRPFLEDINTVGNTHSFEKTWVFHFRFYLHYCLAMICVIHGAVQTYDPDRLIVIRKNPTNKLVGIGAGKDIGLGSFVERYAFSNRIKIQYIENGKVNKEASHKYKEIISWAKRFVFECQLHLFPLMVRRKNTIIALEDTYNMPSLMSIVTHRTEKAIPVYLSIRRSALKKRILEMLKGEEFSFLYIPTRIVPYKEEMFLAKLSICVSRIRQWLGDAGNRPIIYGVDLSIPLLYFIEENLSEKMLRLYGKIISMERLLDIVEPKKVFAQHSLGISYALGEVCSRNNIPAMLVSHGSHVPHTDEIAGSEWSVHAHTTINSSYPFVALQTPWAVKFLRGERKVKSFGIKTGPLLSERRSLDDNMRAKLRLKIFGNHQYQRIILHAGTPKGWHSFRPLVYETVDEYIRNINDTIKAVESISGLYLAIRFRPQKDLNLLALKMLLIPSSCYGIYIDGKFSDYLVSSDLLLSYSSTTIEESLQHRIPVLQYDPDGKYEHIPGHVLSNKGKNYASTVYSVLSENDLIPALRWWCKHHPKIGASKDMLAWSEHILEPVDDISWLTVMES